MEYNTKNVSESPIKRSNWLTYRFSSWVTNFLLGAIGVFLAFGFLLGVGSNSLWGPYIILIFYIILVRVIKKDKAFFNIIPSVFKDFTIFNSVKFIIGISLLFGFILTQITYTDNPKDLVFGLMSMFIVFAGLPSVIIFLFIKIKRFLKRVSKFVKK